MTNNNTSLSKPVSAQLTVVGADDFLPPPGQWSTTIGKRVAMALGAVVAASFVLPFEQTVRASGVVRPTGDKTLVQSQLAGRVEKVLFKPNQLVQRGQVLAVLDQAELKSRRDQSEQEFEQLRRQYQQTEQQLLDLTAELQSAQSLSTALVDASRGDVEKASATLNLASDEMQRFRELAQVGAVPRLLSQEKAARFAIATSELRQAQLGVAQQRARFQGEQAKLNQSARGLQSALAEIKRQLAAAKVRLFEANRALASATIRAPMAGSIVSTNLNHPGQIVSSGEVLARLAPSKAPLQVKVMVSPREVSQIKAGQLAYLRISGCPHSEFGLMRGKVETIAADTVAPPQNQTNGQAFYEVSITPNSSELKQGNRRCALKHGMDLNADVMTARSSIMGFIFKKLRLLGQG
jgi:multidrug efflux pump subunit AcrA (membrane-fusion protein)